MTLHAWAVLLVITSLLCTFQCATASTALRAATATTEKSIEDPQPQSTPGFEVDIIFPRNETYNGSATFPIVFDIQNPSLVASYGPVQFIWGIMPWGNGNEPGGVTVNQGSWSGYLSAEELMKTNPFILANYTNTYQWYTGLSYDGPVHQLQWLMKLQANRSACTNELSAQGSVFFTVNLYPDMWSGQQLAESGVQILAPNIASAPQCPLLNAAFNIASNSTSGSEGCIALTNNSAHAHPCDVKVDAQLASSISSEIFQLATQANATSSPTSLSTPSPTHKSGARAQAVTLYPLYITLGLLMFI